MNKPERWVVVCGAVRELIDFKLSMATFLDWRHQGLVDGIVLSTWEGSFEDKPTLRKRLLKMGVVILENPDVEEPGPYHFWRQIKCLYLGLQAVPDGAIVLKARTDKNSAYLPAYKVALTQSLEPTKSYKDFNPVFQYKVSVSHIVTTMPGVIHDMLFLGYRDDLFRFCHFDGFLPSMSADPHLDPCFSLFNGLLAAQEPWIRDYYQYLPVKTVSTKLVLESQTGPPKLGDKFYTIFVRWWIHAAINLKGAKSLSATKPVTNVSLFSANPEAGLQLNSAVGHRQIHLLDPSVVGRLLGLGPSEVNQLEMDKDFASLIAGVDISKPFRPTRNYWRKIRKTLGLPNSSPTKINASEKHVKGVNFTKALERLSWTDEIDLSEVGQRLIRTFGEGEHLEEEMFLIGREKLEKGKFENAVSWLKRSANRRYAPAQLYLGYLYLNGVGGLKIDPGRAHRLFQRAARRQVPGAADALDQFYKKYPSLKDN
ncbi:MAG: tetratricopeptide repeat protein [Opitutales bacterium]